MSFNPDRHKPAHEVIFSRKTKNIIYPNPYFNNVPIVNLTSQKHLGLNLDAKLTFNDHVNEKIGKAMKGVGLMRKLQRYLLNSSLLTIYKSLIRSHLSRLWRFHMWSSKIESIQYNAAYRSSHPEVFLRNGVLKICNKFTGEHPCQSAISIKLQSTSAWVFSCKVIAFFQNIFSQEHLWVAASVHTNDKSN